MAMGRPKAIIKHDIQLNLKLTKVEAEKILRVAKQKNLTKTEAILQGIDLLEKNKPKLTRSQFNQLKGIQPKVKKILSESSKVNRLCSTTNFSKFSPEMEIFFAKI